MAETLRNWEIVMLALYLEGAASKRIHTEDVTLRCFKLAPDAFSWLRHREYPDKEVVRKDLIRLRQGNFGANYVTGRAGITRQEGDGIASTDGWLLTNDGITWLLSNQARLEEKLGTRTSKATRQESLKALQRVRTHELLEAFRQNRNTFVPALGELADMLRCRVDSEDRIWQSRFAAMRNQARMTQQDDIVEFLDRCEQIRPNLKN